MPERHRGESAPAPFGHGGVGVHDGEQRPVGERAIPGNSHVDAAESGRDLGGLDQGVRDAVGLGDLVESVLRRGVGDGERRRFRKQQVRARGRDVAGERDVQAGVALARMHVAVARPQPAPPVLAQDVVAVDRGEFVVIAAVPRVIDPYLGVQLGQFRRRPRAAVGRQGHVSPPVGRVGSACVRRGTSGSCGRRSGRRRCSRCRTGGHVRSACASRCGRPPGAAQDVGPVRDRFEVIGVHATSVAAQVVNHESVGDRAAQRLVRDAVRVQRAPVDPNLPVAVGLDVPGPLPAAALGVADLVEEPVGPITHGAPLGHGKARGPSRARPGQRWIAYAAVVSSPRHSCEVEWIT